MHGYEMIQQISERSGGFWRPSPGSVYPTLQLLTDEGLITNRDGGGKRLFELTDEGRAETEKRDATPPWEHIARDVDPNEVNLRTAMSQLVSAIFQVSQAGTSAQKSRAVDTLNQTRRELYAILGEIDEFLEQTPPGEDTEDSED
jgi:DNA-binding PadR family transcriptional regulator